MTRTSIQVPGLHHGGAPIPQACRVGNLLASSGISPIEPGTGEIPPDIEQQVPLVFANLRRVLEAAGGSPEDVVKCTFFVRDRAARALIDPEWLTLFPDEASRPARHTLRYDLPGNVHLQCEVLAVLGGGDLT